MENISEKSVETANQLFWKAKYTSDEDTKKELLQKSLALAEKASAEQPNAPAPLFAWISAKGDLAVVSNKMVALSYIRPLEEAALRLKKIDEKYLFYAADRILGKLYHSAPGVISIGSNKKAREHYELAAKAAPEYPPNQIYYADFLADRGEIAAAKKRIEQVFNSRQLERYPTERKEWEAVANAVLEKVGKESK